LKNDIDKMAFEGEMNRESVKKALHDGQEVLEELRERVAIVENEQEVIKQGQSSLCAKMNTTQDQVTELKSAQEDVQQRVAYLGEDVSKHLAIAVREQEMVKKEQEVIKQDQSSLCDKVNTTHDQMTELKSAQEDVQQHVAYLGEDLAIALREQEIVKKEQDVIKQDQSPVCDKVNTTQDQMS